MEREQQKSPVRTIRTFGGSLQGPVAGTLFYPSKTFLVQGVVLSKRTGTFALGLELLLIRNLERFIFDISKKSAVTHQHVVTEETKGPTVSIVVVVAD